MPATTGKPAAIPKRPEIFDRIMGAALSEFRKAGLNGVKIEVIARKAKVSKQLIYYYYGSCDKLYQAILEEYSAIKIQELLSIDYSNMSPRAAMRALLEQLMNHFEGIPFGILAIDPRHEDAMYLRQRARRYKVGQIFDDILERGIADGTFSPYIDKTVCYELSGMMIGGFFLRQKRWIESPDYYNSSEYRGWRDIIIGAVIDFVSRGVMDRKHAAPADMGGHCHQASLTNAEPRAH
jgi:AcrR family transcriptional regulator